MYICIMNWTDYFLNIAEQIKLKSKDESTQIGAVVVGKDKEILTTGYNSFPRGLRDDLPERQERPQKYFWIEHAERNAVYNAARIGVSLKESAIYLTSGLPCADCARAIINAGIKTVYCKRVCTTKNKDKWVESQNMSLEMLGECGVDVVYYDSNLTSEI
jgi:dCMP deaminase